MCDYSPAQQHLLLIPLLCKFPQGHSYTGRLSMTWSCWLTSRWSQHPCEQWLGVPHRSSTSHPHPCLSCRGKKRKVKFTLFSKHNGSLLRRQPGDSPAMSVSQQSTKVSPSNAATCCRPSSMHSLVEAGSLMCLILSCAHAPCSVVDSPPPAVSLHHQTAAGIA